MGEHAMTEQLEPYEQRLKDLGLPTLAETKQYRETTGWVPYEEYMKKIYFHHSCREFDDFNMRQDWCDKQLEPDKLLRETAYLLGLKHRPLAHHDCDTGWNEDDQKELEEELYNKFLGVIFSKIYSNTDPWPDDEI